MIRIIFSSFLLITSHVDAHGQAAPTTTTASDTYSAPTTILDTNNEVQTINFYHGFKHLGESGADQYLIEQTGTKQYSEWQSPPLTYFGPSTNNQEAKLTYKYSFDGSLKSAKTRISLSVWNFNVSGAYGSGSGEASAWASKDGSNWVNLIDLPTPTTSFSDGKTFESLLPSSVLGGKDIYLQIRMKVEGAPNSSYTTAQFGRSDANANKDIFYLDANYSSDLPRSTLPSPWFVQSQDLDYRSAQDIEVSSNDQFTIVGSIGNGGFAKSFDSEQSVKWTFSTSKTNQTFLKGVSSDNSGNFYLCGHLGADDNWGGLNVSHNYERDPWVGKVDASGNWQWVKPIATSAWSGADAVYTDSSGNSFITGYVYGTAGIGTQNVGGRGWYDAFLAKIDADGNWQWAVSGGSNSGDFGKAITVDSSGNIYWAGNFRNTATFGNISLTFRGGGTVDGGGDIFIAKLDSSGNFIWATRAGSNNENSTYEGTTLDLTTDAQNNVYISGNISGDSDFGDLSVDSRGGRDGFLAKLNSSGDWQWVRIVGGSGDESISALEYLNDNTLVVAGSFSDTITLSDGTTLSASANSDSYILTYNTSGELLDFDTLNNSGSINISSSTVNSDGNIIFGGTFTGDLKYANQTHQSANTGADKSVFALFYPLQDEIVDLTSGLVAWYPFDGNASDMSGNGNDGTVYGATLGEDRNGEAGKAYQFDGNDDYIEVSHNNAINPEELTISLWANAYIIDGTPNSGGYHYMSPITSRDNYNPRGYKIYKNRLGSWDFIFGDGTSNPGWWGVTSIEPVVANKWVYLSFNYKNDRSQGFIDGVKIGEKVGDYSPNLEKPLRIGAGATDQNPPNFFFNGSIDNIRIYNRALSEAEVQALYELEKPKSNFGTGMKLTPLGRKDESDFGKGSNFVSGFTLDGNRIAAWQESGNGIVNIWDISESGTLTFLKSIASPDKTYDKASFGSSIVLKDAFMGVGSYLTWRSSPHDGRFYVYDWQNGTKKTDFNPDARSAQYFGMHATISSDVFAVSEAGASHDGWRVPGATTFYSFDGFQTQQLLRYELPGSASHARGGKADGDFFVTSFHDKLASPQKDFIKLWKVERNEQGKAVNINLTDSLETERSDTSIYYGNSLIHGDLLFLGLPSLVVDGIKSGSVYVFKISSVGKLELLSKIVPENPIEDMSFGSQLTANGNLLFITSPNASNGTSGTGTVTAFSINEDNSLSEIERFSPSDLESDEKFGDNIKSSGDLLAVRASKNSLYFYRIKEVEQTKSPKIDLTSGLVAWYPFDGNASDMSGNGNHGTVYGATLGEDRNGEAGKAYQFDGLDDRIVAPPISYGSSFTISLWANIQSIRKSILICKKSSIGIGSMQFFIHPDDYTVNARVFSSDDNFFGRETLASALNASTWYHLTFRYTPNTSNKISIFRDSIKVDSSDETSGDFTIFNDLLIDTVIGAQNLNEGVGGMDFFSGLIDDVRIYNRALSEAEVQALYELEKPKFNMAECMKHLPVGSLIAIPVGTNAPSGLSLVQQNETNGFDLYQVDGPIPVNESFAVGVSEVIKDPNKFGLFSATDINATRETSSSEGLALGKLAGEYSVINDPTTYGLYSSEEMNASIANAKSEGETSVISNPSAYNLVFKSSYEQALLDANASAEQAIADAKVLAKEEGIDEGKALGISEGQSSVTSNPSAYNLVTQDAYDQMMNDLMSASDSNATHYTEGWFYHPSRGWMWTDLSAYPYFYDATDKDWMYFQSGNDKPKFYRYKTKTWLTVE